LLLTTLMSTRKGPVHAGSRTIHAVGRGNSP
jgi:hypothetical protein